MDLFSAIVLGILQGVAEWLPISSQGQVLATALTFFNLSVKTAANYSIYLHAGTLISALVYFRKEIIDLAQLKDKKLLIFILIATIATGVTGLPAYIFFKHLITDSFTVLIVIGVFLIITGLITRSKAPIGHPNLSPFNAMLVGLGQGFSILPGISRSGVTTSVLLFQGFSPDKAFRYSFLLSIPAVIGAEVIFGLKEGFPIDPVGLIAIAVAAVIGYFSMDVLIKAAKKINFSLFCIGFGLVYIALAFL